MATTAFELIGRIILEGGDRVRRELDNVRDSAEGSGRSFSIFGSALKGAGLAIGAAATGIGALAAATLKMGVEYNATLESSTVAWKTLLGTQANAEAQLKRISDFAKTTQFDTANVDQMAKYMHNAGLEGDALFAELTKVADVSGAFNLGADSAAELTKQMSQVRQSGVAMTEDLNILGDRGVPILQELGKVMGVPVAEVKKLASEGKITSELYLKAFDNIAKGVEGASLEQSKTFNGMISSMQDNVKILAGALTEGIFARAKGFMTDIGTLLEDLNKGFAEGGFRGALLAAFPESTVNAIIGSFNALSAALKWIIDNWVTIVAAISGIVGALVAFEIITAISKAWAAMNILIAAFRSQILLATLAQWGLNTAMLANPMTWVAVAIGVLIAAAILLWKNWDEVSAFFIKSWNAIKETVTSAVTVVKEWVANEFTWLKNTIYNIWNGIVNNIKWFFGLIYNNIVAEMDKDTSYIYAGFKWVWDKIIEVWNGIKGAVAAGVTGIKDAFAWVWDTAVKPLVMNYVNGLLTIFDIAQKVYDIGLNIVRGLARGITAGWTAVKDAVSNVASKGKNLWNSLWGIKSPSTFTQYIGRMLGEGMSLGIDKSTSGVLDSARSMATGAMGALTGSFSPSMNMGGGISGGLSAAAAGAAGGSYSIEIPLVVNGKEVARAIAPNMDQELERQRQLKARGNTG